MFDENQAKAKLAALTKEFNRLVRRLSLEEQQRVNLFENLLKMGDHWQEFVELTSLTVENLNNFTGLYEDILAYVLLLEPHGHYSETFKDLYIRYQLLEKMIKKLSRIRVKEIKALRRKTSFAGRFFQWSLKNKIKKEFAQVKIILALTLRNKDDVEKLSQALKKEKQKQFAYAAAGGTMFFVPFAGTALLLLSKAVFDWLNRFTPNYKKLAALLG